MPVSSAEEANGDGKISPRQAIERALNTVSTTASGVALSHSNHKAIFDAAGVSFRPTQGGPNWHWRLVRMGRADGAVEPTPKPYVSQDASGVVRFDRGSVIEEWVPRANAVEQRFVLMNLPNGTGDFVVDGAVTSAGSLEQSSNGWMWRSSSGVVSLGQVTVFDANGAIIPATMEVDAGRTRIVVDGDALDNAAYPVTIDPEVGTNDLRVSAMDTDADANYDGLNAVVAYNSTDNEFLVVWHGDTSDGSLVDEEFEIYGQRIDAGTGAAVGNDDFRISTMGTDGSTSFSAFNPAVAYNSAENEYLVVWEGDDSVTNGFDIYGQRIYGDLSDGDEVGSDDFQISDMGPAASNGEDASEPDVVYNSANNEYLVVWHGDDTDNGLAVNEQEVFAQRIYGDLSDGDEVGFNDIRISDMGGLNDATYNAVSTHVAYNSTDDEYLVVWMSDDNVGGLVDEELEVFGQRLDGPDASEIGSNDFRISDVGGTGTTVRQAFSANVAFNSINNEYLVVWVADDSDAGLADNELEVFGQRLVGIDGSEVGNNDFRISDMGGTGDPSLDAAPPEISYSPARNEYLVVWSGDDNTAPLVNGENEIFGQFIFGDSTDGDEAGTNDFRLSDMGTDGDTLPDAHWPAVDYGSNQDQYAIVWHGDDDNLGLADDEFEIFLQRFEPGNAPPALTLPGAALDYDENDPATIIDAAATSFDPDSNDYDGGGLTVSFTANGTTNDQLAIQDSGTPGTGIEVSGTTVSFDGSDFGVIDGTDDGVNGNDLTVNFTDTAAMNPAVQALMRAITYENTSDDPSGSSRTVSFTATDNLSGTSFPATKTINVAPANDGPSLTLPSAALDYDENDSATPIDAGATVTDDDSLNFDTGSLTVSLTTNGTSNDQLAVQDSGTPGTGIEVSGSTVSFDGDAIATITGNGANGADLTMVLDTGFATPTSVQALVRAITYANSSEDPSGLSRTATFTITDGDTGTSGGITQTINVAPENDDPSLALPGSALNYGEGDPAKQIDSSGTVSDDDSADMNGGALTVSTSVNGTSNDQLGVEDSGTPGTGIEVSGSTVSFDGSTIGMIDGTDDGVNGNDLTVNFTTASATPAAVQALVRAITYANSSMSPSTLARTVSFAVTDGDTGTSSVETQTVNVGASNDDPSISLPSSPATFTEGGGPIVIDSAALVSDPDGLDFDTATLTVAITMNNSDDDRLGIQHEGNASGEVGVSGSTVSFGGTPVGTFSGGSKAISALVITFNTSATESAVRQITRNITFDNVSLNPSSAPRTVQMTITDGDGGTPAIDTQMMSVGALPLPLHPWGLAVVMAIIGLLAATRSSRLRRQRMS
jgi:hypothetical protein